MSTGERNVVPGTSSDLIVCEKMHNRLVIGWKLDAHGHPSYWGSAANPVAGAHAPSDLITLDPRTIDRHAALIAQSGSGKSFFLGRLVEEIVLQTKARCLILDPNADFRLFASPADADLWQRASYDAATGKGKLPTEARREDFTGLWDERVSVEVRTLRPTEPSEIALQIWWPNVATDVLISGADPQSAAALRHCHNVVRRLQVPVLLSREQGDGTTLSVLDTAEILMSEVRTSPTTAAKKLKARLQTDLIAGKPLSGTATWLSELVASHGTQIASLLQNDIEHAADSARYAIGAAPYYFALARELQQIGLLAEFPPTIERKRVTVIDIASLALLDHRIRELVISEILETTRQLSLLEWKNSLTSSGADTRVPTFIIIDEAHNLAPAGNVTSHATAIREQLRTVAAEGRKYGLHLFLVSQRADKLDPLILSECRNLALMRIGAKRTLDNVTATVGIDALDPTIIEALGRFKPGEVLLLGEWAGDEPVRLYSAARRTREGGKSLDPTFWTTPMENITTPS